MLTVMFVPSSLKKTENKIIEELQKEGLETAVQIKNYDQKTGCIEVTFSNKDSAKELPPRIKAIVDKYLLEWRKTYT
jgi:hypothetical protein